MDITKIASWATLGISVLSFILWGAIVWGGNSQDVNNFPMVTMFIMCYVLAFLACAITLYSGFKSSIHSRRGMKSVLIHTGIFFGILIVSLLLSLSQESKTEMWVNAGLIAFYIYMSLAVVALIYTSVRRAPNRKRIPNK